MNTTAAKHSENKLKFCGQYEGMSSGEVTSLTDASWTGLNPWVMWDTICEAEGDPVPFVPSAHKKDSEGSNLEERVEIGVGIPMPY